MKIFFSMSELWADEILDKKRQLVPKEIQERIFWNNEWKRRLDEIFFSMNFWQLDDIKNLLLEKNWTLKSEYNSKAWNFVSIVDENWNSVDNTNIPAILKTETKKYQLLNFLWLDTTSDLSLLIQQHDNEVKKVVDETKQNLKTLKTKSKNKSSEK